MLCLEYSKRLNIKPRRIMIPYILTDNSLTVVINGKSLTMSSEAANFPQAKQALAEGRYDDLEDLFDLGKAITNYANGNVSIENNTLYFGDEVVNNHVVDRILEFMQNDLPFEPLVKFLEKLLDNPSRRAVDELYRFLEHKNMPLTPDGNFLAYKGVDENFMDRYSGKFSNAVGEVLEMPRRNVCDDANIGCSHGFHAGSYEYAKGYAHSGGNLMIVEINPADVVSVPHDCNCQKLRTTKYKVVAHHETIERPLNEALVDDWYEPDVDSDDYNAGWEKGYAAGQSGE